MKKESILVTGLSPTIQKTLTFTKGWTAGEVNRTGESIMSASGKGANAARILAQQGDSVKLLTQTGGKMGDFFIEELENAGVSVCSCPGPTEIRFCYTMLTESPFSMTELVEEGDPVPRVTEEAVRREFEKQIDNASWLVVAGSASPGFSSGIYKDFITLAAARGVPVVIDRHGPILREILEITPLVVKINMYEFLLSYNGPDEAVQDVGEDLYEKITERGKELYRQYGHRFVLTNGERDTLVIDGDNISRIKPLSAVPVNPIGCGDSVTAGVASGLNKGFSLNNAAELGMEWAALNLVRKEPGTVR